MSVRVLVLGGSNFIGRTVVRDLVGVGHEVAVLNRGTNPIFGDVVEQLVADRTDPLQVDGALSGRRFDVVVDTSATTPAMVRGTAVPVRRTGLRRYVFLSTAAVYAEHHGGEPAPTELDPTPGHRQWADYGVDNATCEQILDDARMPGLTILRPPYVYGPLNDLPREAFVWARILSGREILIPADPHDGPSRRIQCCAASHISAVVGQAVAETLDPGTYNIAGDEVLTFEEYVRTLAEVAERDVTIRRIDPTASDVPDVRDWFPYRDTDLVVDTSKLRRSLAISAPTLREGLAVTLEWFRRHGDLAYAATDLERHLHIG